MEAVRDQRPPSLLDRALRWIGNLETAMDFEPIDALERRVADLERRFAERLEQRPGDGGATAPRAHD